MEEIKEKVEVVYDDLWHISIGSTFLEFVFDLQEKIKEIEEECIRVEQAGLGAEALSGLWESHREIRQGTMKMRAAALEMVSGRIEKIMSDLFD